MGSSWPVSPPRGWRHWIQEQVSRRSLLDEWRLPSLEQPGVSPMEHRDAVTDWGSRVEELRLVRPGSTALSQSHSKQWGMKIEFEKPPLRPCLGAADSTCESDMEER